MPLVLPGAGDEAHSRVKCLLVNTCSNLVYNYSRCLRNGHLSGKIMVLWLFRVSEIPLVPLCCIWESAKKVKI